MSDVGAGSSQGGGSQGVGQQVQECKEVSNLSRTCQSWLENYITRRAEERAALTMKYQPVVHEDYVDLDGDQPIRKGIKRKSRGPLDTFVMSLPHGVLKGRKDMKGVFGPCDKDLRDNVCGAIARWFYDAGIPFNAASHDNFMKMTELIGQYRMGLKLPSQYELRYPLLQIEVANVQAALVPNREEWAVKGCSIMSDGWRDYVVQKDIVNFLVNSPKGSVFIRSKEVSEVVKDATMLFKLLDDMVVTDNASNYVKAGKLLEAKRPHLLWTPCAAHCLDLIMEDIGKIEAVKSAMKKCMFINAYIYCRVPLVNMMRSFTTMTQFHLQQANLKKMVTSEEWNKSK
ncbi:unnamed protein product [Brassica oleracea]